MVYDTSGSYGFLGQEYAIGAGNLATHFGQVTAEPVSDYVSGQVGSYNATIYIGSTYNEALPVSFLNDVLGTNRPVLWMADNVWQLSGATGTATDVAFQNKYGWDPATSEFDTADGITQISYKGQQFTRYPSGAGVLAPHVTNPSLVTTLANAVCSAPGATVVPATPAAATGCNAMAQTTGSAFPWALGSANLTYIGEVPLSYISETDRYLVFSDLLGSLLAPSAPPIHDAMVRLEDVSAADSASSVQAVMSYLETNKIPFSVNIIPLYLDPNGYDNNGTPVSETIGSNKALVRDLKQAIASGYGSINEEGYSHQYSNPTTGAGVANPYDGVSGDDFEFYSAHCSTTPTGSTDPNGCPNTDYVVESGPLPADSAARATSRIQQGQALIKAAGLPAPDNYIMPHYAGSLVDYQAINPMFRDSYDRKLYFYGQLSGQTPDYTKVFGQFFPYTVSDLNGAVTIPENLGDYEPVVLNNHPPRLVPDLIHEAALNSVLTSGVASFFYQPSNGTSVLGQIVQGIKSLGFTFVNPNTAYNQFETSLGSSSSPSYNPVAVTGLTPSSGAVAGGNSVVISGAGFVGATKVLWGGQSISYTALSASQITVTAPAQSSLPSTVDVQVVNGTTQSTLSSADQYSYVSGPTITSVSPDVVSGSTPVTVTVSGTNLAGATSVDMCGDPQRVISASSTTVTATSPLSSYVGGCWLTVITPSGTSNKAIFNFEGPLAVTGLTPSSGAVAGGNSVVISGAGFVGATKVLWGGQSISYTALSASQITVTAPAQSSLPSTVDVQVVNGTTQSTLSSADQYSYVSGPTITSVSPDVVSGSTPVTVTVSGTNLAGATSVDMCGDPQRVISASSTTVTATSPLSSYVGGCWLTVITPSGTSNKAIFNFGS